MPTQSGLRVDGDLPQQESLAVVEQTVKVEGGDGMLRFFETRQLASSDGQSGSGFQDTYDIVVPKTSAALALKYNADLSSEMEIYDFSQGRFVKAAAQAGGVLASVSLSPSQISDGLVRVRFREARLFQGAGVWVDA